MRTYQTHGDIRLIKEILCDCCGEVMYDPAKQTQTGPAFLGLRIEGQGEKGSPHFPEGHRFRIDVCEPCSAAWFANFKHNPLKAETGA